VKVASKGRAFSDSEADPLLLPLLSLLPLLLSVVVVVVEAVEDVEEEEDGGTRPYTSAARDGTDAEEDEEGAVRDRDRVDEEETGVGALLCTCPGVDRLSLGE
jgi:hypothetical protein